MALCRVFPWVCAHLCDDGEVGVMGIYARISLQLCVSVSSVSGLCASWRSEHAHFGPCP